MPFCVKCGAKLPDEQINFCPSCGHPVNPSAKRTSSNNTHTNTTSSSASNGYEAFFDIFRNTNDYTSEYDPSDISQNKVMSLLSYLGVLVVIPLLVARQSPFAKFHSGQGLVLFIIELLFWIVSSVIRKIFFSIAYPLGLAVTTVFAFVWLFLIIIAIFGIYNSLKGYARDLPVIGKIHIFNR